MVHLIIKSIVTAVLSQEESHSRFLHQRNVITTIHERKKLAHFGILCENPEKLKECLLEFERTR